MRTHRVAVIVVLVALFDIDAFLVRAQVPAIPTRQARAAPIRVAWRVGAPVLDEIGSFTALPPSRSVTISGIVQNHRGILVPNAGVVAIRELLSGRIVARVAVNELAQFALRGLLPGLYAAELLNDSGRVIASTPAFNASAGAMIQLAPTIPDAPPQGLMRMVTSVTSAAISAAATSGVLAIAPGAPVSPGS